MQHGLKEQFLEKWERYFPGAALPICFYYTDSDPQAEQVPPQTMGHCLIHATMLATIGRISATSWLSVVIHACPVGSGTAEPAAAICEMTPSADTLPALWQRSPMECRQ